jgi:hypothetical protein
MRTLRTKGSNQRYQLDIYAKLVDSGYKADIEAVGGNGILPSQPYYRPRMPLLKDDQGFRTDKTPTERQASDGTLKASGKYNCGRLFEGIAKILFRGEGPSTAYFYFDSKLELPISVNLCRALRIHKNGEVMIRYEIASSGRHPQSWLREEPYDSELEDARQLAIRLSGMNDIGESAHIRIGRQGAKLRIMLALRIRCPL